MKKTKHYQVGGELDSMESANFDPEALDIQKTTNLETGDRMLREMRDKEIDTKPKMTKPKVMAKTTPKPTSVSETKPAAKPDVTKMSLSERMKASRESARSGSGPTDTRSVSQRLRSAFGMAKGGSASSRADGIAMKGKTRGKMC
jgi:hypothetical protein